MYNKDKKEFIDNIKVIGVEITQSRYEGLMEILPPLEMVENAYLVGEVHHHASNGDEYYQACMKDGDRYLDAGAYTREQFLYYFN